MQIVIPGKTGNTRTSNTSERRLLNACDNLLEINDIVGGETPGLVVQLLPSVAGLLGEGMVSDHPAHVDFRRKRRLASYFFFPGFLPPPPFVPLPDLLGAFVVFPDFLPPFFVAIVVILSN